MRRICYRKNRVETVSEKFRDKSEIVPLNFIVIRCFLDSCFTVVLLCSQSLQSLKDILIDFPEHTNPSCALKIYWSYKYNLSAVLCFKSLLEL